MEEFRDKLKTKLNKKNKNIKKNKTKLEKAKNKKQNLDNIQKKYGTGRYKKEALEDAIRIEDAEIRVSEQINQRKIANMKKRNPMERLYIVFSFIVFVILIYSSFKPLNEIIYIPKLILNNEVIELNNKALIYSGDNIFKKGDSKENLSAYVSLEDIKKNFDHTLYYSEVKSEIITTGKFKVAKIDKKESTMYLDGNQVKMENPVRVNEGKVYLPISEMQEIYNIETSVSEDLAIIVDSEFEEKKEIKLKEPIHLKKSKGILSENLEKLNTNDTYVLIKDEGNHLYIKTREGKYGYVRTKNIENIITVRDKHVDEEKPKLYYIYNYYDPKQNFDNVEKKEGDGGVIINLFEFSENNKQTMLKQLYKSDNLMYVSYRDKIAEENLLPIAKINFNKNAKNGLDTFEKRTKCILDLINKIKEHNIKYIYLNNTNITDQALYTRFLIELKPELQENGIYLALNDSEFVKNKEIINLTDYVIPNK